MPPIEHKAGNQYCEMIWNTTSQGSGWWIHYQVICRIGPLSMVWMKNKVSRPIVRYYRAFKLDFSDNSLYQLFRCLFFLVITMKINTWKLWKPCQYYDCWAFANALISKWLNDADFNPPRDALVQHFKAFWQPRQCNNLSTLIIFATSLNNIF